MSKDYGVSNILSLWMFALSKEEIFRHLWWSVTLPTCCVQFNLKRKMRRYLQTIYTCGRLLSVSSSTKKEQKGCFNDLGDMQEFCVVWFFVTISITISIFFFFFLVNVIVVIHVSYYITVYLNDVKSCIWFGYMCARRRCESQYRKMLYFCYEIY